MLEVNYNYNTGRNEELLVAVPNLVESCWVRSYVPEFRLRVRED